jgi:hypothetical protein
MSTHSSRWTEYKTNCSKLCSLSLVQWTVGPSGSGVHRAARSRHDPNFLFRVITGDESWLYNFDPETKQQSSQWKMPSSPWLKKVQVSSNIKSSLIFFDDIRGMVYKEFLPPGQTANGKFYCEVLRQLEENVRHKWPEMWKNGDWLLHHDNVPAHTSLFVRVFLTKNNMTTVATIPTLTWPPAIATCFLKWNCGWKVAFHIQWRDPSKIATGTKHVNAGRLHWVLPKMAKSLGSLYTSSRWLLRRWGWKLGLKVSIHVIMSKFSEILGCTS